MNNDFEGLEKRIKKAEKKLKKREDKRIIRLSNVLGLAGKFLEKVGDLVGKVEERVVEAEDKVKIMNFLYFIENKIERKINNLNIIKDAKYNKIIKNILYMQLMGKGEYGKKVLMVDKAPSIAETELFLAETELKKEDYVRSGGYFRKGIIYTTKEGIVEYTWMVRATADEMFEDFNDPKKGPQNLKKINNRIRNKDNLIDKIYSGSIPKTQYGAEIAGAVNRRLVPEKQYKDLVPKYFAKYLDYTHTI